MESLQLQLSIFPVFLTDAFPHPKPIQSNVLTLYSMNYISNPKSNTW